ncbi:LysR family transcriptional regulator [Streptococcus caprae]|uniref:LysR family transcriptional regulator n=1 Tax=Streptococcus caprae TaxID=1640501 RepID=A0ABV8CTI6_9STRE
MNRQRLEYFVDLAETLNYTETAERLFTSQGNVSKQILALEKELGVQLFVREHRQIRLTDVGRDVLTEAQEILRSYEDLDKVVSTHKFKANHHIILHGIPTMSSYGITSLIGQFHKHYPQYDLSIEEEEGTDLSRSLRQGHCHLIFNRYFEGSLPEEDYLVIDKDELVVVLPQGHKMAEQAELDLADLKDETFLELGHSSKLYGKMIELCQAAGFTPKISYQGKRVNYILEFVAQEMGISLMMKRSIAKENLSQLVIRPLKTPLICQLCLVKGATDSPAVEKFWEFVQKALEN